MGSPYPGTLGKLKSLPCSEALVPFDVFAPQAIFNYTSGPALQATFVGSNRWWNERAYVIRFAFLGADTPADGLAEWGVALTGISFRAPPQCGFTSI